MAEQHFALMEEVMSGREQTANEMRDQFILQRASWALSVWEWIYFRKEQSGSFEQRREAIRRKRMAKKSFKLSALRLIGAQYGTLVDIKEDFANKEIIFVYASRAEVDELGLAADFEYIRPIHIKQFRVTFKYLLVREMHQVIKISDLQSTKLRNFAGGEAIVE
ncbi:hypothetical protein [Paenibacillus sp. SN-8-1]|uniref:hypothetical protein n=1 Tax=Paenibacillus sp. SN-8-1 TaxID=3435409 RepID=UPI003D9A1176